MSTRHLELPDVYIDGITAYTGDAITRVHRVLDTQAIGALQALLQDDDSLVLRIPDESAFEVSASNGLSVNIAPGAAIVGHSVYDAVYMQTRQPTVFAGLPPQSELYLFAAIEITNVSGNDTRESGVPIFTINVSDGNIGGSVLLSKITTGENSVTMVEDLRQFLTIDADWEEIVGKPITFPPTAHHHQISEVVGLQEALNSAGQGGGLSQADILNSIVVDEGEVVTDGGHVVFNALD